MDLDLAEIPAAQLAGAAGYGTLNLSENRLASPAGLAAFSRVHTLVLDKNGIRDEGARAVLQALTSCTALTVLSTRGNFLTVDIEDRLRLAVPASCAAVPRRWEGAR